MRTINPQTGRPVVGYPESDGKPMADNTVQFRCIVTIQGGLDVLYWDDPDVFVAGDLFWYPIQGDNKTRVAPDILVVFGRPKGDRSSYLQWLENNIAPQVVFEVLSPGNRHAELIRKFRFYERFGVEEYYIYDPDDAELAGYRRVGTELQEIEEINGWVSPRLKGKLELVNGELRLTGPNGRPFAPYVELARQREQERQEKERERGEKDKEKSRADRLAAQLRAQGIEPEA
jgi:Uma2 family endonuclease